MNSPNPPILVVEDNPIDLDLTQRAFAKHKLTNPIQVARDGEEALDFIPRWEAGEPLPAVILLDLKLPKINGLDVLRRIKEHPEFKVIPVIILTTSAEDSDIQEAYRLGTNSYIIKPVDFEKFVDVAEQIEIYWCVLNTPTNQV
jgi:CheY-like chemotaxis protein